MENSKSEALSTKQIQITKTQNSLEHLDLEFWICLGFVI